MSEAQKRSNGAWIFYAVLIFAALAFSGVFGPSGPREVPYDEAISLVKGGRAESAAVTAEEVVLTLRPPPEAAPPEGAAPAPPPPPPERPGIFDTGTGKKPDQVTTGRIPGVDREPLIEALLAQNVRLDARVSRTPFWVVALWWIVPLVVINLLFFMALRRAGGGGAGGPLGMLKPRTKVYDRAQQEPVRFTDVAGVDEAKDELMEVVDFLKHPARYRALGGRIPRGILLVGPPGTGKTLLARAVAGEAEVPFFSLNASEFVEMFVGLGAARVRDLFEQARKSAPCIVFIDEIDAVGRSRGGLGALATHDEREQTLQQMLAELDGFDPRATVILMAATNRPEVLDPALMRPGRFDRQVIVDRPDLAGREAILRVHARRVPLGPDVDISAVARRTPGMVGADLANIVNEAALAGARRGAKRLDQIDFDDALDRVQLGLRRRGVIMTPAERRRVAYHEAGHALVALAMPQADPVERVSIVARAVSLGVTIQVPRDQKYVMTEQELETKVMVMLGGRAAEELTQGEVSTGAHDDLGRATALVREMITRFGMSRRLGLAALTRTVGAPLLGVTQEEKLCSEETAREIDEEVRERLGELYMRAKGILADRRDSLEAAAEALVARETLSGEELSRIADSATRPKGKVAGAA
ncbi:ATP-dependent zinc metalloprotease FtsH [Polyangium aurulentum]|uniref:ATP-dependent zinc metalloprotease FtsH n=1 Tax=Polyangium aurulentum TaxID=2567896 RepID=UPI0010ADD3E3|nr:ATP-dependent zinc metalloprotease FtsH [Polyangium aurulentum]UQA60756.1 ATP-dependent zinc metalloprotease FtsH [Polyangium aurulentum]